ARLRQQSARDPCASLTRLLAPFPDLPTDALLRCLQRLRDLDRARPLRDAARSRFEQARDQALVTLRAEADCLRRRLVQRQRQDFQAALFALFARAAPPEVFPLDAWLALLPRLARRRHPFAHDAGDLLREAERCHLRWLQRRRQALAAEATWVE